MAMELGCFARLPVELCEEILTVAAWAASDSEKPWLCALSLTSRRTLLIVRPALYDTVCVTATNVDRLAAAIPFGRFALTRRLCFYERLFFSDSVRAVRAAFFAVQDYAGSLRFLDFFPPDDDDGDGRHLRPARATARVSALQDEGLILRGPLARQLTHLRLPLDSRAFILRGGPMDAERALRHVVLESATPAWDLACLVGAIVPFFLSGTHIERVVVVAAPRADDLPAFRAALFHYAHEHGERRLWIHDAPTDGTLLSEFRPGVTFNDEQWAVGRPVLR